MDPDAEKMAIATTSGVHAYVVAGYSRNRLRFDERKLVDRAKGILIGARQLREEEAFRALRGAAMVSKQRIGQVSRVVIDSAHSAEAVNRAGQLRLLSQRIVKFYALACTGVADPEMQGMFADALAHVDSNLAILDRSHVRRPARRRERSLEQIAGGVEGSAEGVAPGRHRQAGRTAPGALPVWTISTGCR
nr:ANTAR domain-containing protein [uncultured Lichenicoccus sp.]